VTHQRVEAPPSEDVIHMPIGRPVGNMQVYVLDGNLQQVPVGVRGELHVGGVGVGRGYLNDAARTAESFVPDPFGGGSGGRLYRTGDRARHAPDGSVEYLGREDNQVKVRGFRIELREIEVVLGRHPGVEESAVVAAEKEPGDKFLAAYFVPRRGQAPDAEGLKNFLRERLPAHMVPAAFIALDRMPLTPNGKLDRRALPAPAPELIDRRPPIVEPRTEIERAQAQIWAEVIRVDKVGIDDNFFDLGGHSLAATQLLSRLRASFGVELTLADFFAAATVREVSKKIEAALVAQASSDELEEILSALEGIDEGEADRLLAVDEVADQSL
jgi:acyl carrier protein